ncbi:MAG: hypothetical protein EOO10_07725 [Chitinophagaceae bacterium]|nr:MAG: hypothetical protein EOO10_07725 [Chitinophagaceae bacterium]
MKNKFIILLATGLTIILFSCKNTNSKVDNNQTPALTSEPRVIKEKDTVKLSKIVNSLIDISAKDFYTNQQPAPVDFKDVKLKYHKKHNGEELYILCGVFITHDKQATQFATLKNYGYEQWVGNNAVTYCQNSREISYTKEDLTIVLRTRYNEIKNK